MPTEQIEREKSVQDEGPDQGDCEACARHVSTYEVDQRRFHGNVDGLLAAALSPLDDPVEPYKAALDAASVDCLASIVGDCESAKYAKYIAAMLWVAGSWDRGQWDKALRDSWQYITRKVEANQVHIEEVA